MMTFDPSDCPHRRYNPLTGQWILVSPHGQNARGRRDEVADVADLPAYDPTVFVSGNTRKRRY